MLVNTDGNIKYYGTHMHQNKTLIEQLVMNGTNYNVAPHNLASNLPKVVLTQKYPYHSKAKKRKSTLHYGQ